MLKTGFSPCSCFAPLGKAIGAGRLGKRIDSCSAPLKTVDLGSGTPSDPAEIIGSSIKGTEEFYRARGGRVAKQKLLIMCPGGGSVSGDVLGGFCGDSGGNSLISFSTVGEAPCGKSFVFR